MENMEIHEEDPRLNARGSEAWTWQPPSAAGDVRVERRSKEA
jgi:hypothetical protein